MSEQEQKISKIDFPDFVKGLLKDHSGLNTETIDILTDETGLPVFKRAFTSKMVSPFDNYEQLEFIGDTIMNDAVALFIFNKYENYTVEWLTYIKHSIISSLGLSKMADFLGFWAYISKNIRQDRDKLLEDVLEAFVGALRQVVESKASVLCGENPPFGLGTLITHQFIWSVLEEMEKKNPDFISDSWEKVKDPKTRVIQIMAQYKLGSDEQKFKTSLLNNKRWVSTLSFSNIQYPTLSKVLTSKPSVSKRDAEYDVSRQAIAFLKTKFVEKIPPKIQSAPSTPSTALAKQSPPPPPARPGLVTFC